MPHTSDMIWVQTPPFVPPPTATQRLPAAPASAIDCSRCRVPNAVASSRARYSSPRVVPSVSPAMTPRACGSLIGVRSPAK